LSNCQDLKFLNVNLNCYVLNFLKHRFLDLFQSISLYVLLFFKFENTLVVDILDFILDHNYTWLYEYSLLWNQNTFQINSRLTIISFNPVYNRLIVFYVELCFRYIKALALDRMVSDIYVAVAFISRTAISVMLEDNILVL